MIPETMVLRAEDRPGQVADRLVVKDGDQWRTASDLEADLIRQLRDMTEARDVLAALITRTARTAVPSEDLNEAINRVRKETEQ